MGYWKEKLMHQQEAGYSYSGSVYVCSGCVTDPVLAQEMQLAEEEKECNYCGRAPAGNLEVLLDAVSGAIVFRYEDPAHHLPYESREGGYQGQVFDGYEVVHDMESFTDNEQLLEDVANTFAGSAWTRRNPFSLDEYESLRYGWDSFVAQIKHHTRYLFFPKSDAAQANHDEIAPGEMLPAIEQLLLQYGSVRTLRKGTVIFRARVHDPAVNLSTVDELGPPPREAALMPNRMSPAGIPMFYGALAKSTAVAETFDPERPGQKTVTLATFAVVRHLLTLDLTDLPPMPSQFDEDQRHLRHSLGFFYDFVQELRKPIARDDSAHVEYVPTQVVTEYVRHRLKTADGLSVDGIMWASEQDNGLPAVVLFLESDQCGPRDDRPPWDREILLVLSGYEQEVVP